jgi:hypothetical protein
MAFNLGSTEPWTPASTPLHLAAAAGRGRVVQALLLAAAAQARHQSTSHCWLMCVVCDAHAWLRAWAAHLPRLMHPKLQSRLSAV